MTELADVADSKSADRKVMGVRPPLPAPIKSITYKLPGDHKCCPLCSNYARTQKVWISAPPNPLFLTGISVAGRLKTTGCVRSLVQALCPPSEDVKTPVITPIRPSIFYGVATHSASKSPPPSALNISRFDRRRGRPHDPPHVRASLRAYGYAFP